MHLFKWVHSISLERPRALKNAGKIEVVLDIYLWNSTYISNWSKVAYLKTKIDMLFFTLKHCQNFTLAKGHGAGVTVGKCMRMEMIFCLFVCFLRFNPSFFTFFSFFPPFSFAFSCAFRMLGPLSQVWLALTGLHYGGTTVNQTFLVRKFDRCLYLSRREGRSKSVGQQLRIYTLPPSKGYIIVL